MEYIKIPANALDQIENKAELVLFGLYYSQISRGQMENYFTQDFVYDILKMNSRTFTAGIKNLYDKELLRWGWGRRDGAEYWARKVMPDKLYWDIEEANSNYLAMQTWWAGKLRLPYNALVFLSAFNSQARKEGKLGEDYSYAERGESGLWVKKTEELDREMLEEELKYPGGHGNAFRRKHGLPEIDMSYNPYDIEADEDAQALGIHWIGEENCDD